MIPRALLSVVAMATVLTACSASEPSATPNPSFSPNPRHHELVVAANLDSCPPSTTASVPGGLPDVTLPCLGRGPAVHLSGLIGKPLVVNIWGSWCGPCQKEAPFFAQVYDDVKGRIRILGVDDEDDVNSALDFAPHVRPPMRYPSVVDEDKKVLIALRGPIAVPSTVFVSAAGRVIKQISAPYTSAAQLRADISRYLGVTA